jgi:hypothetical protein
MIEMAKVAGGKYRILNTAIAPVTASRWQLAPDGAANPAFDLNYSMGAA